MEGRRERGSEGERERLRELERWADRGRERPREKGLREGENGEAETDRHMEGGWGRQRGWTDTVKPMYCLTFTNIEAHM